MSATDSITPLVLITGFLGAGKTTLLQHVLPRLASAGVIPRVIINDFQNAQVDARSLQRLVADVLPISGACVCCGSRDELLQALESLTPQPDSLVLVEANGAADTLDLIEMLTADRRAARYSLPTQVVVVDAQRWQKRHWNNEVEALQVKTANAVVFTRCDEVNEVRRREVFDQVRRLNPRATPHAFDTLVGWLREWMANPGPARRFAAGPPPRSRSGHESHHFASMELRLRPAVAREALARFLNSLPPDVIRAKGVAVLDEHPPHAVLFQKVENAPADLVKLGSPEGVDPLLILIGPRLAVDVLQDRAAAHDLT